MWQPWAVAHLSVCLRPPVGFIIPMATLGSCSCPCVPESTSWLLHTDRLMPCWLGCDGSFQLACFQGSPMVHWDYSWAHWPSLYLWVFFKRFSFLLLDYNRDFVYFYKFFTTDFLHIVFPFCENCNQQITSMHLERWKSSSFCMGCDSTNALEKSNTLHNFLKPS